MTVELKSNQSLFFKNIIRLLQSFEFLKKYSSVDNYLNRMFWFDCFHNYKYI
jgi:hypothetical protein